MWFCFKINTVSFILPAAVTQKTALEMSFEHRFTIHIYISRMYTLRCNSTTNTDYCMHFNKSV